RRLDLDSLQGRHGRSGLDGELLILPPVESATDQQQKQCEQEKAHHIPRQPHRLIDMTEAVDAAAGRGGSGVLVELLDQTILIQPRQLGIGAYGAAGEGMPRQLAEVSRLAASQRTLGKIELLRDRLQRQVLALTRDTQRFARVVRGWDSGFGLGRYHHCSERKCRYSGVPGYRRLSCRARLAAVSRS